MRPLLTLAYELLITDRAKFAAPIVGLTFSVFLMVQMTSMVAGILQRASATVLNTGAPLWVLIGGQAQRLQDTVALFVALGGGCWEVQHRVVGSPPHPSPGG